jgi:ribosomal protein L11 methyltransferase
VIYTRLAVTPSDASRCEAVSAALFGAGAEGVLEEGAALVTVFAERADAEAAARAAHDADPDATTRIEAFDPGDWMAAWRTGVRAHTIDGMTIAPPWLAGDATAATMVAIDPGLGFGTGEHESTRISLRLLQRVMRPGDFVIDVGSGSGVLAIAAAKLGAGRVCAIEVDPLAISNAHENFARNGVDDRVSMIEGDATSLVALAGPARVIVANIIATVLLQLFPVFSDAIEDDGRVIVGGILLSERDAFVAELAQMGWTLSHDEREGEWWGGVLEKHGKHGRAG